MISNLQASVLCNRAGFDLVNKVFEIVSCCDHSETFVWFTVVPQQLKSEVYGDTLEDNLQQFVRGFWACQCLNLCPQSQKISQFVSVHL